MSAKRNVLWVTWVTNILLLVFLIGVLDETKNYTAVNQATAVTEKAGGYYEEEIFFNKNRLLYANCHTILTDSDHAPYLPTDATGRTRPNDPVTRKEAVLYINTLIPYSKSTPKSPDSKAGDSNSFLSAIANFEAFGVVFPEHYLPEDPLTESDLQALLEPFNASAKTDKKGSDLDATANDVTRLEFARTMNKVLQRNADPSVLIKARAAYLDLPENDEDALAMLEAITRHKVKEIEGRECWTDVELPVHPFQDFTTGDLEVDAWIKGVFEEELSDDMSLRDQLAALYRYVRDTARYRKGEIHAEPDTAWVLAETRKMMEEGRGNCFTYSSTLCEMYRALGIDAKLYAGTISDQENPHAWVEATIKGTVYIFDVEMEAVRMRYKHPYVDFFMRTYNDLKGWDYKRDYVVEWGSES